MFKKGSITHKNQTPWLKSNTNCPMGKKNPVAAEIVPKSARIKKYDFLSKIETCSGRKNTISYDFGLPVLHVFSTISYEFVRIRAYDFNTISYGYCTRFQYDCNKYLFLQQNRHRHALILWLFPADKLSIWHCWTMSEKSIYRSIELHCQPGMSSTQSMFLLFKKPYLVSVH